MQEFWKIAPTDIVDYLFLMELFKEYKQPRLKKNACPFIPTMGQPDRERARLV